MHSYKKVGKLVEPTIISSALSIEQPSVEKVVCILQKYRKEKKLENAKGLQQLICNAEREQYTVVGNYSVPMFVECRSLSDAQSIFNGVIYPTEHSWTSLIQGYVECGQSLHAFGLYQKMQDASVQPSSYTLTILLRACTGMLDVEKGRQVHVEIRKKGLERDTIVGTMLINMYAKCGSLAEAREVLDNLQSRNVVSWTTLIAGYAEHGSGQRALQCFKEMELDSVSPNAITFVYVLKACTSIGAIDMGREIHTKIEQKGLEKDPMIGNTLVDMYAKCGSLKESHEVFCKLPFLNVVSWNAMIAGYVENGLGLEAMSCFEQMRQQCISPNTITFLWSLKACGNLLALDKGRELHIQIAQQGFDKDLAVCNALISMYMRCGSLAEARQVSNELPTWDVTTWTALISGYTENGSPHEALKCFEQMQVDGTQPNSVTFICIIKACCSAGAVDKGRAVHTLIAKTEFRSDLFIGNTLVDMYAKCGSFAEAQEVFDRMPTRDTVSWNALLSGYVDNALDMEALKCYRQMPLERVQPNFATFVCSLKACANMSALDGGREIHTEITNRKLEGNVLVATALVDMYAKCGSMVEAWEVFNKVPFKDVGLWNALITGYTENGLGFQALRCVDVIQEEGRYLNAAIFSCALKACSNMGAIDKGRQLHSEIAKERCEKEHVGNALISMYAKCGSLLEAEQVFDALPVQDVVSWSTLVAGYAETGQAEKALKCYKEMETQRVLPNAVTHLSILKACGSTGAIDKGREIHEKIVESGHAKDISIGNALINMYAKHGFLEDACEVFDKLLVRDVVTWTTIIAGYTDNGFGKEALQCFEDMQMHGVSPDDVTFVCSLKACGSIQALDKGREIHHKIVDMGLEKDLLVGSALVDMYAKCGSLIVAQHLFDKLPVRDVVSWSALITGYAEVGLGEEALKCFDKMQLEGIVPNVVTFVGSLKACGSLGTIDKGREIHIIIAQKELGMDPFIGTALVDMYAKCGSLKEARQTFDKLPIHDVVSYNSMIRGYSMSYECIVAIQCFEDMQQANVKPDAITFICLLQACGRASLVVKGQEYLKLMREQYGIAPTIDHHICMIDILARSGQLHEAGKLLENMPCALSEEAWTALLSSCKSYGETELGLRCFQHLIHINPQNSASYVLMANIF